MASSYISAEKTFFFVNLLPNWILSKEAYQSDNFELDIRGGTTFRDLRKPVGLLCEERVTANLSASNSDFPTSPSTPNSVCSFLSRLQPFSEMESSINFTSIEQTFSSIISTVGDQRELVPEFFFQPEIFETNSDQFSTDLSSISISSEAYSISYEQFDTGSPDKNHIRKNHYHRT